MDKFWMVFATLMALYLAASATEPLLAPRQDNGGCIYRYNCTTDCEQRKCLERDGLCLNIKHTNISSACPYPYFYMKYSGGRNWCRWPKVCKCCVPYVCDPPCDHGDCADGNVCHCWEHWTGSRCDEPEKCDPPCVHGNCTLPPDECTCDPGWEGPTCDTPICNPPCQHGNCTGPDQCVCEPGWTGSICDTPICDPECNHLNGICQAPNDCLCLTGWTGQTCDEPICNPPCVHGNCTNPPDVCKCDPGWQGTICNEPICEPSCENDGICTKPNVCDCTEDYYGDVCQYIKCTERSLCNARSGKCWAKNHPIMDNSTACPNKDNGKKWCSPMCACCFD